MKLVTVLRSGGEYQPEHVQWLHRQFPEDYYAVCLSDCNINNIDTVRLQSNWPGWFAKLELFNPEIIDDDILFMDLDTVICGDIGELTELTELMALSDFYFPQHAATGVMFIPHQSKFGIWEDIMKHRHVIEKFRGDGEFLRSIINFKRLQDVYPGKIISYKKHISGRGMPGFHAIHSIGNGSLPSEARIVCFHGNPRPWKLTLPWIPSL